MGRRRRCRGSIRELIDRHRATAAAPLVVIPRAQQGAFGFHVELGVLVEGVLVERRDLATAEAFGVVLGSEVLVGAVPAASFEAVLKNNPSAPRSGRNKAKQNAVCVG